MRYRRAKSLECFKHRRKVCAHPRGVFGPGDACNPDGLQLRVLRQDVCVRWFHEQHRRNASETQDLHHSGGTREVIAIEGEKRCHCLISIRVQGGSQCRVVIGICLNVNVLHRSIIGLPHRHDACGNAAGMRHDPAACGDKKIG
jgi:hypothetical protein